MLMIHCNGFKTGEEEVSWDISAVYDAVGPVSNLGIRVEAEVKEYFIGETRLGNLTRDDKIFPITVCHIIIALKGIDSVPIGQVLLKAA